MWMAEGEKKCQKVSEYETERLCFSIDHCPLDDLVEYQYHCVRVPSLGGNWKSTFSFPLVEVVYFLLKLTGVRLIDIVDSKFQLNLIVEDGTGVPKTTICTLVLMLWL